jgi:hypothetical protein
MSHDVLPVHKRFQIAFTDEQTPKLDPVSKTKSHDTHPAQICDIFTKKGSKKDAAGEIALFNIECSYYLFYSGLNRRQKVQNLEKEAYIFGRGFF